MTESFNITNNIKISVYLQSTHFRIHGGTNMKHVEDRISNQIKAFLSLTRLGNVSVERKMTIMSHLV